MSIAETETINCEEAIPVNIQHRAADKMLSLHLESGGSVLSTENIGALSLTFRLSTFVLLSKKLFPDLISESRAPFEVMLDTVNRGKGTITHHFRLVSKSFFY